MASSGAGHGGQYSLAHWPGRFSATVAPCVCPVLLAMIPHAVSGAVLREDASARGTVPHCPIPALCSVLYSLDFRDELGPAGIKLVLARATGCVLFLWQLGKGYFFGSVTGFL